MKKFILNTLDGTKFLLIFVFCFVCACAIAVGLGQLAHWHTEITAPIIFIFGLLTCGALIGNRHP